mgnify:CR=1 FL=1
MTIADDTDDILTVWGETVTVVRNTPTYDGAGALSGDSWATVSTPQADIQPLTGQFAVADDGEQKISTHWILLPSANAVRQGDRIRPVGWSAGDNEYEVDSAMLNEDHVEVMATLVAVSLAGPAAAQNVFQSFPVGQMPGTNTNNND